MSFLKGITKAGNNQIKEHVKQTVKQKTTIVKQPPRAPPLKKYEPFKINPKVKSIVDIPNVNIMTSGNFIGIRLRAGKKEMLEILMNYIGDLIKNDI